MNAEAAVDAGALEADEDAEFWGGLSLVSGAEVSELVGIGEGGRGLNVACLKAVAKGHKGEGIFIPIADLVRRSLRTGRCRLASGVRGAAGWHG